MDEQERIEALLVLKELKDELSMLYIDTQYRPFDGKSIAELIGPTLKTVYAVAQILEKVLVAFDE